MSNLTQENHCFWDEAGDTTFYGKGKVPIIGQGGASFCFIVGMVKFKEPLQSLRESIKELQNKIVRDPYFRDIPSINKKVKEGGIIFMLPMTCRKFEWNFTTSLPR